VVVFRGDFIIVGTFLDMYIYRMSQEECARLREGVPYGKVYRYNPKHLRPKLNGYGDNCIYFGRESGHVLCTVPSIRSFGNRVSLFLEFMTSLLTFLLS
jgi:hypothetical protein